MHRAWTGFAFELLCMNHISQIKAALGISVVATRQCSWRGEDESGKRSQIDLLIDRRDGVIDLCEAKFASVLYSITKGYESELADKIEVFRNATKTNKSIHLVMVTTFGLSDNSHTSLVQNSITLDDLFLHWIGIDDSRSSPMLVINRQDDFRGRCGIFDDSLRL